MKYIFILVFLFPFISIGQQFFLFNELYKFKNFNPSELDEILTSYNFKLSNVYDMKDDNVMLNYACYYNNDPQNIINEISIQTQKNKENKNIVKTFVLGQEFRSSEFLNIFIEDLHKNNFKCIHFSVNLNTTYSDYESKNFKDIVCVYKTLMENKKDIAVQIFLYEKEFYHNFINPDSKL